MLHKDGRVLLADFGVARLATDSRAIGTPAYMAPEQFRHEPLSPATDIYALGITMFELLAGGSLPFRGRTSASQGKSTRERISWEHQNTPPTPISAHNPKIPPSIDQVILKALAKDPKQRYQSVLALRDDFDAAKPKTSDQQRTTFTIPIPEIPSIILRKPAAPPPSSHPSEPPRLAPLAVKALQYYPITQPLPSGPIWIGRRGIYAGYAVQIPSGETIIGRMSSANIHLSEPSVSRNHAAIIRTRRGVYLRDQQSRMGTFVNGGRIPANVEIKLHTGDVIQLGYNQVFEFRE
jgi:serine/threonine protein kinase